MIRKLSKFSIFLFLLYLLWYKEAFSNSTLFLYGGTAVVAISTLLYIHGKTYKVLSFPKGIKYAIVYGFYSLIIGGVVARDHGLLISSLVTYFAFLFVCCCICIICIGENDIKWLFKSIIVICIFCAAFTILRGYDYYNGVMVVTMGPENNPNTLGALMVFGIALMMFRNKRRIMDLVVLLFFMLVFSYVIILTGSKKSLLSAAILILIWLVVYLRDIHKNGMFIHKVITIMILCIAGCFAFYYFTVSYLETASFERMLGLFTSGSTQIRSNMYEEAYEFFKSSPIFGIGYNQFRVISSWGTYAHSTYAEVLADSGIIGSVIYFAPFVSVGITLVKKMGKLKKYEIGVLFAIYCVEVFLGTVNIYMYDFTHMLMWTILFLLSERQYMIIGEVNKGVKDYV